MSSAKLRAFLAVARHGSFSAGARASGLSQPTLTTQVQSLERQHNVELFHRRGRRIELSDVGRQLLPIAQRIALLELEAHNLLRDSGRLDSGQLKVGAVGPFHVIEMVDSYLQQHPNIDVSIRVGNSAQVLSDLENYVTDIAVLAGRQDDSALCSVRYARHAIILFAHHEHPLANRGSVRLEELEGQRLLQREPGSTTRLVLEQALSAAQVKPRIAMEIGSREALREAVVRGLGLGVVSEAEFIADPNIRTIRIEGEELFTETYLYCLAERRSSRLISSFFDAALS
jgi:aminoethylphosphonate catabolism LysR family transcriptional regulator